MTEETRETAMSIALTIAGSDSSGGAGVQADLKTFAAFGVHGASAVTALTAQNTRGVAEIFGVPPAFAVRQIEAVADDLDVRAVKTGMLGDRLTVLAVAEALRRRPLGPLAVDPVMVATSGDPLIAPDAIDAVRRFLLPLAEIVTPNLHEAARLLGASVAETVADMKAQAEALLAFGPRAALVKGGHGAGAVAVDVLAAEGETHVFERPRLATKHTHGTGCALSAAITALRAQGVPLIAAVARAKLFVWRAIESAERHPVGSGHGPIDCLYAIRRGPPPA